MTRIEVTTAADELIAVNATDTEQGGSSSLLLTRSEAQAVRNGIDLALAQGAMGKASRYSLEIDRE